MRSKRLEAALLVASTLVVMTGCLAVRPPAGSGPAPKRCTYGVSATSNVQSLSVADAPYRAVVVATIMDSAERPLAAASVARMPGGPGAYTSDSGRAVLHLSERDVARVDSTGIVARRVAFRPMQIPVRVAAGDSIDIVASMCPSNYNRSDLIAVTAMGPEHDQSGIGAAIGAVVGTIVGYRFELGGCDLVASRCTGRHGALGGAVVGALLGYAIGDIFKSHSPCMAPDAQSADMIAGLRHLIGASDSTERAFAQKLGIAGAPPEDVQVVTDGRVCQGVRLTLDSLSRASNPSAQGLKHVPSLYVIRAGGVIEAEIPGESSTSYFLDAKSLKYRTAVIVPD